MIKKRADYTIEWDNDKTGLGNFEIAHMLVGDELPKNMKLNAVVTIKPGEVCAAHPHHGDSEIYYILSGKAEYDDNGKTYFLEPGDTTVAYDGESHAIKNAGDTDLVFLAIIPFS